MRLPQRFPPVPTRSRPPVLHAGLLWACLLPSGTQAQAVDVALPPTAAAAPVVPGERLSEWLLRNGGPGADTTSLHWRVTAERLAQGQLRQSVLDQLGSGGPGGAPGHGSAAGRSGLYHWLRALPLTGRLTVAVADARWLQGAPQADPVLQAGHSVVRLPRPAYVAVVSSSGTPCLVPHRPGALARDYLQACGLAGSVDSAWMAQPDGRTQGGGVSWWNADAETAPGPGAWIWAPPREWNFPDSASDNLIRFLATQLPAEFLLPADRSSRTTLPEGASATALAPLAVTANDWGEVGLLQTPTARMAPAGTLRVHISRVLPYTRGTVMVQPFDWMEAGFRYTDIGNRLYGPAIAGTQSYKDKSFDLKLRLREESAFWPQVALGFRDFGGTGLFSGEYLVASKRWGNWDASLGLAWGYPGARGNLDNPLAVFGDGFRTREGNTVSTGGTTNLGSLFHGRTALFGGLQWQQPGSPWVFKFEIDGNDYQSEPLRNNQPASTPLNIGAVYRYSRNVDLSFGIERGKRLMLGLTFHSPLAQLSMPKLLDPAAPAVAAEAPARWSDAGPAGTAEAIALYTGWTVQAITHQGTTTTVVADTDAALHLQERIERAIRVLHRDAPASSQRFVFQLGERGLQLAEVVVDREQWLARHVRVVAPALRLPMQDAYGGYPEAVAAGLANTDAGTRWRASEEPFSWDWSPTFRQILGGPDGFLLYQFGVQVSGEYRFSDRTWLSGGVSLRLLDNYDKFDFTGGSALPRVRTFQREFTTASRVNIPWLQLTHVADLGGGHYGSVYGGLLEWMYAGVGAEWMYRPWRSPFAFGVDINRVRQRAFEQDFGLRDYRQTTGHATLYWDTGWNDVRATLSVGRYLAGDMGATVELQRSFSNGVSVGAWATKTNVSAAQFGEGSFDKGVFLRMPFDVLLPLSTPGSGTFAWNPLTRDGGARLGRRDTLYEMTNLRSPQALRWRSVRSDTRPESAEDLSYMLQSPRAGLLDDAGGTGLTLGRQIADIPATTWLLAGGAVLAAGSLDKRVDRWAQRHQGGSWSSAGRISSAVPYALAAGAGLAWLGLAGEDTADTASTAIKAAAITLGANLGVRYAVGRSRPTDGRGPTHFDGFNGGAFQSGFSSSHVAVAFALATPFAQRYDMPWLYGLAAATAFGRVQKREHWFSDTVGGAFMGYAIGSLLTDQQDQRGVRWSVGPGSVVASWEF